MLDIMFVTDYVCPYCLVAKEALMQALEETGMEARINTLPLELTREPNPRVDTYHDEKRRAGYQILVEPCKKLGLDMKLPPKVIPRPYTRLAFEGMYYAEEKEMEEAYNNLMYRAYFIEEKDIGDLDVLVSLAESIGLDGNEYREVLLSGKHTEEQKEMVEYTKNVLQVKSLPTIYINNKKVSLNEYTKEEMIQILRDEQQEGNEPGKSCSIFGCG